MSSYILRCTLRMWFVLGFATFLCLMLPRTLCAMEGAIAVVDKQAEGAAQAPLISDISDSACKAEIEAAVRLGYMGLDGRSFKPDGKIRVRDFLACVHRGMSRVGMKPDFQIQVESPKDWITRQQAAKMLALSVLSADELAQITQRCGGPPLYLSDFTDSRDVASWAEPYVAAAVYRGWISERYRLYPKEPATREFAAALLARAFPDPASYTGLVVYVCDPKFKRAQSMQIITDEQAVYPARDGIPSIAFSGAPGMASYCGSLQEAKERRVGSNPLAVSAVRAQRGKRGEMQIVLTPEEARAVLAANERGLFLETWRVAVVEVAPGVRTAMSTPQPAN